MLTKEYFKNCKRPQQTALIYQLNQLHPIIQDEINWLNRGGCGFFAMFMLSTLKELGYKNVNVHACQDPHDFRNNLEAINRMIIGEAETRQYLRTASHYLLTHEEKGKLIWFDGEAWGRSFTEVWDDEEYQEDAETNAFNELSILEHQIEYGDWNSRYDRAQNDRLRKIIDNTITIKQ